MKNLFCKKNLIEFALRFSVVVVSVIILFFASSAVSYDSGEDIDGIIETAKVIEITENFNYEIMEGVFADEIIFVAELTSGEYSGTWIQMIQQVDSLFYPQPVIVSVGDDILVTNQNQIIASDGESYNWAYTGHNRLNYIYILVAVFIGLILLFGRAKGLAAIITLVLTIAAIFYFFLPSILTEQNIYLTATATTFFVIFSSLFILNGFNKKSISAIIGNCFGIVIAGVVAYIVNAVMDITGVLDQDYIFLTMLENNIVIDLQAVVWAGVLIGALGAIMDVSMSIASAMQELYEGIDRPSFKALVRSGLNIGRDAIGTMTNTLILAYVGSSLAIILLFTAYNRNPYVILNLEMILVEIISAIVGSIGIIMAVPSTVFVAASIYMGFGKRAVVSTEEIENKKVIDINEKGEEEIDVAEISED